MQGKNTPEFFEVRLKVNRIDTKKCFGEILFS